MVKTTTSKRIIELALSVAAAIAIIFALGISASAESYKSINLDVPRISQRPGVGDCAIASMATVEAYCHGLPSGDYNSTAYQAVYSANGYSVSATWSVIGYTPIDSVSLQTLYDQLKTGYPVIVHRTSNHYSVVYGYDGSTSSLQMSGFKIVDVDDSYNSTTAYKRLDEWRGRYSLDRTVIRKNGLAISSSSLKINGNHPAEITEKGSSFTPYGMVISNKNITSVVVSVVSDAGKVVQSHSAAPNSTKYSISNANGDINISKLAKGSYVYKVAAKDSSGSVKTTQFAFGIDTAPSPIPEKDEKDEPVVDLPEIKQVSYKAIVKAEPSLNMRKGADVQSAKITSIPYGTVVTVTAECNGWGMVSYNGYAGWVLLTYTEKYTEPTPTHVVDPVVTPVVPGSDNIKYARITAATSLKSTKFIFASNVADVPKNAIVKILSADSGWFRVIYNGTEGYVTSSLCVAGVFDVDGNSKVNSSDALIVLEASIGKRTLTASEKKTADANGDGVVNSADALIVLAVSTGEKKY